MEIILFLDKQKAEQLDRRFNMGFRAFLKLQWCIHEAVGKAEGTGLGRYYPLKSVEILPNQILRIIYLKEEREIKMEGKFFENLDYMFLFGYVNLL